ncbi:hypothetical protein IWQ60_006327 [Tieghemiomyces parasiticus]|uniref:Extracellular membrane protein CFEM domain-containing protein n=1 Tax=Tieghemiomyces parasiticus TaxID=78921 RepID=A0A9W8A4K0_9FUNG|nr:hypothetical protein IWQ60_006327 [Tieghemiomyces parasiticus]
MKLTLTILVAACVGLALAAEEPMAPVDSTPAAKSYADASLNCFLSPICQDGTDEECAEHCLRISAKAYRQCQTKCTNNDGSFNEDQDLLDCFFGCVDIARQKSDFKHRIVDIANASPVIVLHQRSVTTAPSPSLSELAMSSDRNAATPSASSSAVSSGASSAPASSATSMVSASSTRPGGYHGSSSLSGSLRPGRHSSTATRPHLATGVWDDFSSDAAAPVARLGNAAAAGTAAILLARQLF